MNFIKKWEDKFPILYSLNVLILFEAVLLLSGVLVYLIEFDGYYQQMAAGEFIAAIFAVVILIMLGKGKSVLKSRVGFFKSLLVGTYELVLMLITFLLYVVMNSSKDFANVKDIAVFAICMLLVGITEEVIFRGIIEDTLLNKYGKDRKGLVLAVFISGIIFGLSHLANIGAGINPFGVLIQVLQTVALGAFFGAIYMRTHNIFALIFLHSLMDFVGLANSGLWEVGTVESSIGELGAVNLIAVLVYLIPAIFLMRPSKLDEVLQFDSDIKSNYNVQ